MNMQNNITAANSAKTSDLKENFASGMKNARNILGELERSINKSSNYEKRLVQCKSTHIHSHDWWDASEDGGDKRSANNTEKSARNVIELAESWSTMSIVCLQYQYEDLSKRYKSLLEAYNDKCSDVTSRDVALSRLRHRARDMHAQLVKVNKALLSVGEKYLALKKKRDIQVCLYEKKMGSMKSRLREVVSAMERARLLIDGQFSQHMAAEQDCNYALLLAEMQKCNQLFIENLQLKAQLEDLMPDCIHWNN